MTEKPSHFRESLKSFSFAGSENRWSGCVAVIRRDTTVEGNTRRYIDLQLQIGERFLNIPRDPDAFEDMIAALREGHQCALASHEALMAEIRTRGGDRSPHPFNNDRRSPQPLPDRSRDSDRRRSRRDNYDRD